MVGLNYEDPNDRDSRSKISFGRIDSSEVHGGYNGLRWYKNKGINTWALTLMDLRFGGEEIESP